MKLITGTGILLLFFTGFIAQAQNFRGMDKSPLDYAYYPDNFAHDRKAGEEAILRVLYSRPQKKDRDIFGKKVPYGKVWRTGANEATEIQVYKDITIGGKKLKAGTYSLFTIPTEKDWTIIFNSDLDYWGAYSYKESNDVLRITASSSKSGKTIEAFTIQFKDGDNNEGIMQIAWDDVIVDVPFKY
ncbi:DUF2911 domain-containing protein [Flexithrix dorotheae]|uniref:DUF2911 domain-containing protein n=1 Tax=Flexithrix dorotheae TaxID=70993 RepID=UPI000376099D|nr:DUF2911 domain-containing protein [Flexithrix dorotheae]